MFRRKGQLKNIKKNILQTFREWNFQLKISTALQSTEEIKKKKHEEKYKTD